jgi:hypothetical protein
MNDGPTWLNPGGIAEVGWDFEMCQENDPLIIAKELLQQAYQTQLTVQEAKMLEEAFDQDY